MEENWKQLKEKLIPSKPQIDSEKLAKKAIDCLNTLLIKHLKT